MIPPEIIQYSIDAVLAGWLAYVHTRDKCSTCQYEYTPKVTK